ncbi:unnamed protein product [Phaeothamnion confervicola]
MVRHGTNPCRISEESAIKSSRSNLTKLLFSLAGATVTSFKSSDGTELLFVSEKAVFDGKKAIRGGIPLVFPQFGQPKKAMSSHGFARTSTWNIGESSPEGDNVTATFTLQDSPETKEVWPHAFRLRYVVSLNATSLTTTLHIENAGDAPFDFQTLLHTYLRVPDIDAVQIEGFKGLMYDDKVAGGTHTEERGKVTFAGEMDRVYKHPEEGKSVPDIVVMGEGSDRIVTVAKSAAKSGGGGGDAAVGADCVLWNPWVDKAKVKKGPGRRKGCCLLPCYSLAVGSDIAASVAFGFCRSLGCLGRLIIFLWHTYIYPSLSTPLVDAAAAVTIGDGFAAATGVDAATSADAITVLATAIQEFIPSLPPHRRRH